MSTEPPIDAGSGSGDAGPPGTPDVVSTRPARVEDELDAALGLSLRTIDRSDEPVGDEREVPSRIGRYLVLDCLGHGGMGVVLEAFDPDLDRRVALKLLRSERSLGSSRLRLLREAQAMARLSHPNVVQVHDVGVDDDRVFLAMELVRGGTLRSWLRERPRGWAEILSVFVAAGHGLQAAHEAGLIHRDFKPDNVLMGEDGRVRVADFGLVGADGDSEDEGSERGGPATTSYLLASLTATGGVLGTPLYMAPEQYTGRRVGPAADQFAFCVALHEALLGAHPFHASSAPALAVNVVEGRYVAPTTVATVPRWLLLALRRGLASEPADRYPSLDELLRILEREPGRRRRRWAWAGALGLGLGSIGGMAWLWGSSEAPCSGGPATVAQTWSEPRREAVVAAMVAQPGHETDAEVMTRALDGYAERWAEAHHQLCLAHRDEAMSDERFDAAMGCLERGRAALDGVVATVTMGGPEVVSAATTAAAGLSSPSRCGELGWLALDVPLPAEPERAAAVVVLRERLARVEAVHDAGALSLALEELDAIAREVSALDHLPLRAELALVSGRLAMERGEWVRARRELALARSLGVESGMDLVAAEAAARALFVAAMLAGPESVEPDDEAMARALVGRVGQPPALAALLANNLGVLRAMAGDRAQALASFQRALSLADEADDVDPVDRWGYVTNVAIRSADPQVRDELLARAERLVQTTLGPGHRGNLELALLRARFTVDPREARRRTAAACERTRQEQPVAWSSCQLCHWRLAELDERLEDQGAARTAAEQALRCLDGPIPEEERGVVQVLRDKTAGYAAVLRGDHAEALARLDAAARALQGETDPGAAREWADVALLRARSLRALGRGEEAIEPLRRAIAAWEQGLAQAEFVELAERRDAATRLLAELEAQRRSSMPSASSQR